MKNAEFILSVSLSDPLCFTHNVHWCVFVFLSRLSCRESLSLSISSILHFHQSVPFLCLIVSPSHSSSLSLSHITCQNLWLSRCQICISPTSQILLAQSWTYTVQRLCRHDSFICNTAMQHPGQALPLVDVCLSFLSRKKYRHHSLFFFFFSIAHCSFSRIILYHNTIFIERGWYKNLFSKLLMKPHLKYFPKYKIAKIGHTCITRYSITFNCWLGGGGSRQNN